MAGMVDFHTHLGSGRLGRDWNASALVRLLDRYDIERAVVMPWDDAPSQNPSANDEVAEAMSLFPDRLIGFARIHPKDGDRALVEFRRAVEGLYLHGLKLHPLTTGTRLDDPVSLELVRMAADYGMPVYYHSGDDPSTQPTMFEIVTRAIPHATLILGHGGGFLFWRDAAELAARFDRVYLSTPGSMSPMTLQKSIAIADVTKILFGSDTPAMHMAVELAKVHALSLREEERRLILSENARVVLGTALRTTG